MCSEVHEVIFPQSIFRSYTMLPLQFQNLIFKCFENDIRDKFRSENPRDEAIKKALNNFAYTSKYIQLCAILDDINHWILQF